MTALLVCPVCEEAGEEPCDDVIVEAVLASLQADASQGLREVLFDESGLLQFCPCCAVPLLVAQPAWPAVLAAARDHDGSACDPIECDACVSQRSVMQVNCWYWRTLERAVT